MPALMVPENLPRRLFLQMKEVKLTAKFAVVTFFGLFKADKVGFKYLDNDGVVNKVRYYKSNNEIIDRV